MKNIYLLTLSLSSFVLGIDETILINSSSFTNWKYFSFNNGQMIEVEINPDDSYSDLNWDIALMRNHFRTNSGKSGSGIGGALVDSSETFNDQSWEELTQVFGEVNFTNDGMLDNIYDIITHTYSEAPGSLVLETWGWFDFSNNYQFNVNNYKYIIRNSTGNQLIKIWIKDYYNELGQSAHITLRYSTDIECTYDECGICGGDSTSCFDECPELGDFTDDGVHNVLDIVALVNCVLQQSCVSNQNACAADINSDNSYNILDVVALVNCVLDQNCEDL